ncbi:MAG: alpha/beta hydrolase [Gammaproteobacteria bacterium]|nr:alpha/beta hydrolase [Gammaproteobacteria bacterium]
MPGLDGTGKLFAPLIPLLQPHFDLNVVTYPDLGSFNEYIDCAQGQLPEEPGYSLVAESFSGPVALALMARWSSQIGPSVLCATFARSPLAAFTALAGTVPEQMFSIGALSEFFLDVDEVENEDFSETQPLPMNVMDQIDGILLKRRITAFSRIDVSALLPQIEAPILYLNALRDRILSRNDAIMMQQSLSHFERVDIDGPHLLLQARPRECAELIHKHVMSTSNIGRD